MNTHEEFIVRVIHRVGGDSPLIIGKVGTPDGKKSYPFRTAEELWWILLTETGDMDGAPPPVPDTGTPGA